MYCDRCGTQVSDAASFCSSCGKSFGRPPGSAPRNRVAEHTKLLGIFWIVLSAVRILPGFFLIGVGRGMSRFLIQQPGVPPFVPGLIHAILPFLGTFLLIGGALGIAAGWGLLTHQSWARMLAIILAILHLLSVPLGTALGIYTLWVLWPSESEREYGALSHA